MKVFWRDRSMQAAVAPVPNVSAGLSGDPPSSSAGPSADPLPGWDRRAWLVTIPLAIFVIYAFIPTLDNGFVASWDDDQNFLDNPYFRGLGVAQVKWAWSTFWLGAYEPLAWLLFETQYVFCKLDPRGYHLTSLLLQVANAVVLYVLTVALLGRCQTDSCLKCPWMCSLSAGLATALFAVHPLRVEAVAWASCQPYLPCILFSMLSVLAYLRAFPRDSSPRWGWLAGSFLLFVAALLFKAVAVSLPVVLLILDFYPLRRFEDGTGRWFGASVRRALLEKVPFVIVSLFFMGRALAAKPRSLLPSQDRHASEGIAQACFAIWFYIRKTVLPLDLFAFYPLPKDLNWLALPYSLSILATVAVSVGLFLLRRRWPGLLATWLCYLVILAPNSGIIGISNPIVADRYSDMSMLGSVMVAAAGFCWLWRMSSRWRPGAIGIVALGLGALLGLTALTRNQCRTWFDAETLFAHAVTHGGSTFLAQRHLGVALQTKGKYQEAEAHFAEAVRLNPGDAQAHNSLGSVLYSQGKYEEAEAHFTEAVRLNPQDDQAHNNLGKVLSRRGKYEDAVAHYTEALRLNRGFAEAHNNWGVDLQTEGNFEAAEAHYAEAVRYRPGYAEAHNNWGAVLYTQGKHEAAAGHFTEALRLSPGFADAHNNLGVALQAKGNYPAAEAHFAEAVRLNPGYAEAHANLGAVLYNQGKYQGAETHFAEAVRLNPADDQAHNNLGLILSRRGDSEAAAAHFTEALRLNPSYAEAHNNLGVALLAKKSYQAAAGHFVEAAQLNPDYADAHYNLANLLFQIKKYDEAEPYFIKALRLNPNHADAHEKLGIVLFQFKKYEAAAAHFTEALRLNPGLATAHYNLGLARAEQQNYEAAATHFTEALRLNPSYADAHNSLGSILSRQGKYGEAEAHFVEAVSLNPRFVQAHYNLGLVYSHFGDYEGARDQFTEAIRLDPGCVQAYNAGAMLMAACPEAQLRDGKRAVQFANRACELTTWKNPIILDTLAAAQAEAGDFETAVKWQKRAIELLTDEQQKADCRSRLVLYQAKKPYRQVSSENAPTEARP